MRTKNTPVAGKSEPPVRNKLSQKTGRMPGLLYAVALVIASDLLAFTLEIRVNGFPILDWLYLILIISVVTVYAAHFRKSRVLLLYMAGIAYLAIVTIMYWQGEAFDNQFFILDVLFYSGLPVGAALAVIKGKVAFRLVKPLLYSRMCHFRGGSSSCSRLWIYSIRWRRYSSTLMARCILQRCFYRWRFQLSGRGHGLAGLAETDCLVRAASLHVLRIDLRDALGLYCLHSILLCTAIVETKRDRKKILYSRRRLGIGRRSSDCYKYGPRPLMPFKTHCLERLENH